MFLIDILQLDINFQVLLIESSCSIEAHKQTELHEMKTDLNGPPCFCPRNLFPSAYFIHSNSQIYDRLYNSIYQVFCYLE